MKFICHRGNINGKNEKEENQTQKILYCISKGYQVEIDVWKIQNEFFLGHDGPEHLIEQSFLIDNSQNLWCHAKNLNAFDSMLKLNINCFWHQNDDYTLTSKGFIWVFPNKKLVNRSICVMPENADYSLEDLKNCYGICSDNIEYYKKIIGEK